MDIITFLIIIAFIVLVLGAYQIFGKYVMTYKLTEKQLSIIGVFGFFSIPYDEITDINIIPPKDLWKIISSFNILRLGNRLLGTAVLIKKKSGIFRSIVISPDNPHDFVAEIRKQMESIRGAS